MAKVPKKQQAVKGRLNIQKWTDSSEVFGEIKKLIAATRKARNSLLDQAEGRALTYGEERELGRINIALWDMEKFRDGINNDYIDHAARWHNWTDEAREENIMQAEVNVSFYSEQLQKPDSFLVRYYSHWEVCASLIQSKFRLAVLRELKAASVTKTLCYVDKEGFTKQAVKPVTQSLFRASLSLYLSDNQQ